MKRHLIYHTHIDTGRTNQIDVDVVGDEIKAQCNLDRVSRDGLTLSCDANTLSTLMPNKANVSPKDPICFSVTFKIPQKIEAKCRVIFARRLSKNEFVIELKFIELAESSIAYLDNFIDTLLKREATKSTENKQLERCSSISQTKKELTNDDVKLTYSKVA